MHRSRPLKLAAPPQAKGPRNNKVTKCFGGAQPLPYGRGSVKCAHRAARVSKRLGLNAQDISPRLPRIQMQTELEWHFARAVGVEACPSRKSTLIAWEPLPFS